MGPDTVTVAAGSQTLVAAPTAVVGTFIYTLQSVFYTDAPTCTNGVSGSATVIVKPVKTITLTSALHSDTVTVCTSIPITPITYNTTEATGVTFFNLPSGITGNFDLPSGVITISGSATTANTYAYQIRLTGGVCDDLIAHGLITVHPNNTINWVTNSGSPVQSVCLNSSINPVKYNTTNATSDSIIGLPAGVSGSWAGGAITISGTPLATGIYNYTVKLFGGCGTISTTGKITVNTLPWISVGNDVEICSGQSTNLFVNGPYGFSNLWSPANSLDNPHSNQPLATPSDTTNYVVVVTDTNGCQKKDSMMVYVGDPPAQVSVCCSGTYFGSATLTATIPTAGIIYWEGTTHNGDSTNMQVSSKTVTASGTYYFRAKNNNIWCWGPDDSATVVINLVSNPDSITASSNVMCAGTSVTLFAVGGFGTVYWFTGSRANTGQIATGNPISVSPTTTTTYYARNFKDNTWSTDCASKTIIVNSPPTAPTGISGNTTICNGESTTLTATGGTDGSGATYQWYAGSCGSGSVLSIGPSLTVSPSTTTTYYVRRVGNTTCNNITPCASQVVTVRPTPTASISGAFTVCQHAATPSITFTNPQAFPVMITYTINNGPNHTVYVAANSAATVAASTNVIGTFTYSLVNVVYQTPPTCLNSISGTAVVVVTPPMPLTPGPITGNISQCPGLHSQIYSVASDSSVSTHYNWTVPSGWVITAGWLTNIITVTTDTTSGYVTVKAVNDCDSSIASVLHVTVNPPAPVTPGFISGDTTQCPDLTGQLYALMNANSMHQNMGNCETPGLPDIFGIISTSTGAAFNWAAPTNPVGTPPITYYWVISNSSAPDWNNYIVRCGGTTALSGTTDNHGSCLVSNGFPASLTPNTLYYLHLYAHAGCTLHASGWVTKPFVTKPPCVTPAVPQNLHGNSTSQTSVSLSWTPGAPPGSSNVTYYWTLYNAAGAAVANGNTLGTSAYLTGLSCETTYYFTVYAQTNCDGSSSAVAQSTTFSTAACSYIIPDIHDYYKLKPSHEGVSYPWDAPTSESWKDGRMEEWKNGKMEEWKVGYAQYSSNLEEWKNGKMEEWKDGRMEEWKNGKMEEWKVGYAQYSIPPILQFSNTPLIWKDGKMEEWKVGYAQYSIPPILQFSNTPLIWKDGKMEVWKVGYAQFSNSPSLQYSSNLEEWKNGKMEVWKVGYAQFSIPPFLQFSNTPLSIIPLNIT